MKILSASEFRTIDQASGDTLALMENAGTLRLSRDRGCTFEDLADVSADSPLWLAAAPGGGAYGFALNGTGFYEIAPDGDTFVVTKRRTPATSLRSFTAIGRPASQGGASGALPAMMRRA